MRIVKKLVAATLLRWGPWLTGGLGQSLALAAVYFIAGRLALLLAIPPGYATAVWPPAGFALAGVLLCGSRVWPGIFLGSFALNLLTAADPASVQAFLKSAALPAVIGAGAALQAIVGGHLIRRFTGTTGSRNWDLSIVKLLLIGGPLSCLISPTCGVSMLWAMGAIPVAEIPFSWMTWWVGDSIGALIFAPLALLWTDRGQMAALGRKFAVTVPLVLLFTAVVLVFISVSHRESQEIRAEFDQQSQAVARTLERRLGLHVRMLHSIEGLIVSSREVNREQFRHFANHVLRDQPDIHALSWNPRVKDEHRTSFEAAAHQMGHPEFHMVERDADGRLQPAAHRVEYNPILHIEPYADNQAAVGFDIASEPARLRAMRKARDSGQSVATSPVTLVQGQGTQQGFIALHPVYRYGRSQGSVEDRRLNLLGYAGAVFRINDIVKANLSELGRDPLENIHLRISDRTDSELKQHSPSPAPFWTGGAEHPAKSRDGLRRSASIGIAGRTWILEFAATPQYLAARRSWAAWSMLAGGLLLTGILGAFLLVLTGRTAQIEGLVGERTANLRQVNEALTHRTHELEQAHRRSERQGIQLAEKSRDLAEARDAALEASRLKSEFLANMSHEIRTPMNGVLGTLELAAGTQLTDEQRKYVEIALSSAQALLGILNDILDLSKIEANQLQLEVIPFSPQDTLRDTIQMFAPQAATRGVDVQFRTPSGIPDCLIGDPLRLRQILVNLVGNAVKFTERGRVEVRVECEAMEPDECRLHFSVQDTGIGIPAERQALIFQPFTQADGSTTRQYGGTGLGLAIVSQLVTRMGGRLWLESEPGWGSTFHFTAGFGRGSAIPAIAPASAPSRAEFRALRILLAEDNLTNRFVTLGILEKQGHEVMTVVNGREAVDQVREQAFDLVLMDVQMPVMDGLTAVAAIREWEKGAGGHLPVVALTAHALSGDRERCLGAGMDAYVTKPIRPGELLDAMAAVVPANGFRNSEIPGIALATPAASAPREVWNEAAALSYVDGNHEMLMKILGSFVVDHPTVLGDMRTVSARGDMPGLARAVHALRGTISMLGAEAAAETAQEVERLARQGMGEEAASGSRRLEAEVGEFVRLLRARFPRLDDAESVRLRREVRPGTRAA